MITVDNEVKENWRFIVGNDTRIRFWLDLWCGTAPLRHSFPILFDLVVNKFETVADVWDQTVGNSSWKLNLYRDFNDWEVALAVALLNSLQKERVSSKLDKISWKAPIECSFLVSEAVKVLSPRGTPLFPIKGIWVHCVPTKATFFAWEATWGKILTLDKLQRKGWHLPNCCYLCGCDEESAYHILF